MASARRSNRNTGDTGARARAVAVPALDARLVRAAAAVVIALVLLAIAAAGVRWVVRSPMFTIRALQLEGELVRTSPAAVRAQVLGRIDDNFFAVDLAAAQAAFETLPWVRRAVVRRVWPDRLAVGIEEHHAVALWAHDDERNPALVNRFGEVFDANVGAVDDDQLPVLDGPSGSAAAMLAMYRRLAPLLAAEDLRVRRLVLSGRGSWRIVTDERQLVELGRGTPDEVMARTERFARTLPQVIERYGKALVHADLRHDGGYAIRLDGVTTGPAAATAAGAARTN